MFIESLPTQKEKEIGQKLFELLEKESRNENQIRIKTINQEIKLFWPPESLESRTNSF